MHGAVQYIKFNCLLFEGLQGKILGLVVISQSSVPFVLTNKVEGTGTTKASDLHSLFPHLHKTSVSFVHSIDGGASK